MKHRYKFYQKQYRKYVKSYNQTKRMLAKEGKTMYDEGGILKYRDFKDQYLVTVNAYQEHNIKKDPVKTVVQKQAYEISYQEARGYQVLLRDNDLFIDRSMKHIRTTSRETLRNAIDWDRVRELKDQYMIDTGADMKQANHWISQTYFGSK